MIQTDSTAIVAHVDTVRTPAPSAPPAVNRAQTIAPVDTVPVDTVPVKAKEYGVLLTYAEPERAPQKADDSFGMSCLLGGLALLFCIIGYRFKDNSRYISKLFGSLTETRLRSNVFDETVRETSFLVLLDLMWALSAGIILWGVLGLTVPDNPWFSFSLPQLQTHRVASIAICMGIMVVYTCLMALAYVTVGAVFSDAAHAKMWAKGFAASLGLMSIIFFPLSLVLLFYPQWTEILLWIALGTFLLAKIVFIWKGFRIFFTQISSWVLFLYYLCSLEIVPLILTYLAALGLTGLL